VHWISVAGSDIGAREEQQDRYLVVRSDDGSSQLLAVADGAGGHTFGALAAQTAIKYVQESLPRLWASEDPQNFISDLIDQCNQKVIAVGKGDLACSTLVIVFMKSDEVFWGHVGDSRFYLIRDGHVVAKTSDHSIGQLRESQQDQIGAERYEAAENELYMCLGALDQVTPELDSSAAREGDSILLCSDGLWGQTDMAKTIADLSDTGLSQESLSKMVKQAISAAKVSTPKNSDNITLIASKFIGKPSFFKRLHAAVSNRKRT